jgi:hypothetical protein
LVQILELDAKRCETRKLLFVLFNLLCCGAMQGLQWTLRAAGREAAGAAVVCSMMALHAEDEVGG